MATAAATKSRSVARMTDKRAKIILDDWREDASPFYQQLVDGFIDGRLSSFPTDALLARFEDHEVRTLQRAARKMKAATP